MEKSVTLEPKRTSFRNLTEPLQGILALIGDSRQPYVLHGGGNETPVNLLFLRLDRCLQYTASREASRSAD
jgi:hypothetical protein